MWKEQAFLASFTMTKSLAMLGETKERAVKKQKIRATICRAFLRLRFIIVEVPKDGNRECYTDLGEGWTKEDREIEKGKGAKVLKSEFDNISIVARL